MIQSIIRAAEYEEELLYSVVCRHFEALHVAEDIKPDMKVAIKPNFVMACKPEIGATTHPLLIKAVVMWLKNHGVKYITVAESSGGVFTPENMKKIYSVCGVMGIGIDDVLNFDTGYATIYTEDGFANKSFHVINPINDADYIINIPKIKTHGMVGFSCGMKNLFGVVPGLEKPQLHFRWPDAEDFSNMIFELGRTIAPEITIVDAIEGMEGNGPTGGDKKYLGYTFASRDMYTQDWYLAKCIGLNPEDIIMLRQARAAGLVKLDEMEFVGDEFAEGIIPFVLPDTKRLDFADRVPGFLSKPTKFVLKTVLKSYPKVDSDLCVGCGKCAESCPPQIIKIKNRKAHFRKRGCISCFCCQEMCPMKAISIKKAL